MITPSDFRSDSARRIPRVQGGGYRSEARKWLPKKAFVWKHVLMLFGVSFGAGSGRRLHCIWNVTSSLNLRLEGSDKRKNTIIQYDDTIYNNIVFEGNLREGPGRRMMMTMMTMTMMMMMMMMVYFGVIRKRNNGKEQKSGKE